MSYSLDGVLTQRQAEYLAGVASSPERIEYMTGKAAAWIVAGQAVPAVVACWAAVTSRWVTAGALAAVLAGGLILALVAGTRRRRSLRVVRLAAWTALVTQLAVLAFMLSASVAEVWWTYFADRSGPMDAGPEYGIFLTPIVVGVWLAMSVPTIIGFGSSVGVVWRVRST